MLTLLFSTKTHIQQQKLLAAHRADDKHTQILNIINQLHKGRLRESVSFWKNKRERNLNPHD